MYHRKTCDKDSFQTVFLSWRQWEGENGISCPRETQHFLSEMSRTRENGNSVVGSERESECEMNFGDEFEMRMILCVLLCGKRKSLSLLSVWLPIMSITYNLKLALICLWVRVALKLLTVFSDLETHRSSPFECEDGRTREQNSKKKIKEHERGVSKSRLNHSHDDHESREDLKHSPGRLPV